MLLLNFQPTDHLNVLVYNFPFGISLSVEVGVCLNVFIVKNKFDILYYIKENRITLNLCFDYS